ncbi:MAG: biotin/lipoyl-binding protein [Thermoplasmata archaeon]|nr:biotin/lipoyl-binding protein [Thermoplasmata archaeon]
MLVTLTINGKTHRVEVDLRAATVAVDGVTRPMKVITSSGERAELEIDGETVVIEGWPEGLERPLSALSVNGERVVARVEGRSEGNGSPPSAGGHRSPPGAAKDPGPGARAEPAGPGVVIRPPMPGKVIEVRVREGEVVRTGQVLLVLEAMKMRNDVLAPSGGTVQDLRVVPGANVRAREAMLRIAPATGP